MCGWGEGGLTAVRFQNENVPTWIQPLRVLPAKKRNTFRNGQKFFDEVKNIKSSRLPLKAKKGGRK